jgi:hypothetical protein
MVLVLLLVLAQDEVGALKEITPYPIRIRQANFTSSLSVAALTSSPQQHRFTIVSLHVCITITTIPQSQRTYTLHANSELPWLC